jgi:tetratricopeptide (TPR) repeat protein
MTLSPPTSRARDGDDGTTRAWIADLERLRRSQPQDAWERIRREFGPVARRAGAKDRGELWRLRGHVLRALRRTRAAVDSYRRADHWYGVAGEPRERGRCAIGLVDSLMYLGRYAEAEREARRGRRLLGRARDGAALARLLNNEGNLHHRLDRPDRALERYRAAHRALRRAGDPRSAAMVEGNIANCLSLVGRTDDARRLYRDAGREHAKAGFAVDALNADYNLAYLDFLEHRYERALDGLDDVRRAAAERGAPSLSALAALDRSEILLRLGAHHDALAEATRAIAECAALGLGYERAKAHTFAAIAEFRLGRRAAARARLEGALADFHREGNRVWLGETLVGLATLAWSDGHPRAATPLLSAAARTFALAGDLEREGCARALLARVHLACGRLADATRALERAQECARKRPTARLAHLIRAGEAESARSRGDLARARRLLKLAASEAESLAARILDEQWRASFWGDWGWAHHELASLEIAAGRLPEAFEALERGRGRVLVGASRRGKSRQLSRPVRAWAAGKLDHDRRMRSADGPASDAAPELHRAPGRALRRALRTVPPRTVNLREVQSRLAPGTLLVDYFVHREELGLMVAGPRTLGAASRLVSLRELSALGHRALFALRSATLDPSRPGGDPALDEVLTEIAALALWPALARAGEPVETLAVVPVGPLARLPWAALPLPDGRRVCEAMELVVVPGLRLGLSRAARLRPGGAPLVVASDSGELESVRAETERVAAAFPGAVRLEGAQATAEAFLRLVGSAAWVHFAGHGLYRADSPHRSGLRLADRWVTAEELEDLDLSARWMSLSACQTARALLRPGEEWFGLARTLLMGGAGAVVASQWDIEDAAAARLMSDLYPRLAGGAGLGAALAAVQAGLFREGIHPLSWAGFVVLGGPGAGSVSERG